MFNIPKFSKKCLLALVFLQMAYIVWRQYSMISSYHNHLETKPNHLEQQWCHFPKLDIDAPAVKEYFSPHDPLKCSENEKNWIFVLNGTFYIDSEAEDRHGGKIHCNCTYIRRVSDEEVDLHLEENIQNGSKLKSDFFKIDCQIDGSATNYTNYHTTVLPLEEVLKRSRTKSMLRNALGLNVYMLGFDSLSRLAFIRNLPKMYKYLTEEMDAIVLEGYNIVGDGTPQALIPILTGKTEEELPLTRRRYGNASYVNIYPFVWNEYRDAGYATLHGEDASYVGTFTYRLKGFKEQPTDHYMRTFYMETEKSIDGACYGSQAQHQVHFDYVQQFWEAYPMDTPKFAFHFHSGYSHGSYNRIQVADNYMVDHLKFFRDGHWNNTIIIVMADHGHRFGKLRETTQGKLEERLPFFSFVFPPWFKKKYPDNFRVFKENSARLTSPFDIHATLQEILNFSPNSNPNRFKKRSLSLFHPIPIDRTCAQAGIDVHWCTCLTWNQVSIDDQIVQSIASDLIKKINEKTETHRNMCSEIKLSKIDKAHKYSPAHDLLRYKKAKDQDGFVPDFSGHLPKFNFEYYQLDLWTDPGNAHYQASITWYVKKEISSIDLNEVSHMNAYGNKPHCIIRIEPSLMKWCKCYDKL